MNPAARTSPILLDFPAEFSTGRLLIRAPRPGDGTAINAAIHASHAELRSWMPWAQALPSPAETEVLVRRKCAEFILREDLWLILFVRDTGTLVGMSGLHRMDWRVPRFEIGYWAHTAHSGRGYITEAVRGVADFAREHLHARRLEIRCDARNTRSSRVAERAGFTLEGVQQHDACDAATGEPRNSHTYVRIF